MDADRRLDLAAVREQAGGGDAGQMAHCFPSHRVVLGIGYQAGVTGKFLFENFLFFHLDLGRITRSSNSRKGVHVNPESVYEDNDAINMLDSLSGLTPDLLREVVESTYLGHVQHVTPLEPPSAAGITMWIKGTRNLRERLIPLGWTYHNQKNLPITVCPDKSFAIVVNGGNEDTGRGDRTPRTRSTKGGATQDAIDGNQLKLFDAGMLQTEVEKSGQALWILLVFVDDDEQEIRLELSKPIRNKKNEPITDWHERIIVKSVPLTPAQGDMVKPEAEVEIETPRRIQDSE